MVITDVELISVTDDLYDEQTMGGFTSNKSKNNKVFTQTKSNIIGDIVEEASREWINEHYSLSEKRILIWKEDGVQMCRELDAVAWVDNDTVMIFEVKSTPISNKHRQRANAQLKKALSVLSHYSRDIFVLCRGIFVDDETEHYAQTISIKDRHSPRGLLVISKTRFEQYAIKIGNPLPDRWMETSIKNEPIDFSLEKLNAPIEYHPLADAFMKLESSQFQKIYSIEYETSQ
jgi:hypothetical protein